MRRQYCLVGLLVAGCGLSHTHEYSAGVLPTAIVSCACVIPDAGPVGPAVSDWDEPFLTDYVQLTFADSFHKAGRPISRQTVMDHFSGGGQARGRRVSR